MRMPSLLACGVVLATALLPARALATPPSRDAVRQMLSGYEQVPTTAQWRALGPGTLRVLVALYDDRSEPPYVRLRAVTAAASFPSRATRTFLLAVARLPGQSDLFTREAVLALGRAFGARAVDDVVPFLSSPEPVVREGAALCLGRVGTPAALEALRARLVVEGHEHVRRTISRSLERPSP